MIRTRSTRPIAAACVLGILLSTLSASAATQSRAPGLNPHIPLLALGDLVWLDANDNGAADPGETPIDGVRMVLYRDDGDGLFDATTDTFVSSEITANGGLYRFSTLPAGDYFVQIPVSEFEPGLPLAGLRSSRGQITTDVNNMDHGAPAASAAQGIVSHLVTLAPGTEPTDDGDTDADTNLTIDFGFTWALRLGNLVWADTNDNGRRDTGEAGLAGLTVRLLPSDGATVLRSTTTDASGLYEFAGLAPGAYRVEVVLPPGAVSSHDVATSADPDNDVDDDDNGVAIAGGAIRSGIVTLAPGDEPTAEDGDPDSNLTVDFGIVPPGLLALGNLVWADTNDNGVVDGGEAGIAGVTVRLLGADGTTVVATTTTDATGHYLFDQLVSNTYFVEVVPPSGAVSSRDIATSSTPDNDVDNDDNGVVFIGDAVRSGPVTLGNGTEPTTDGDGDANTNLTVDFGFVPPGLLSLGNLVWLDLDNDARADPGEPGIAGVAVRLLDGTGASVLAATVTDAAGHYRFSSLRPGTYRVEVERRTGPVAGYLSSTDVATSATPDNDVDNDDNGVLVSPVSVRSAPITLSVGSEPVNDGDTDSNSNLTLDFGFVRAVAVGNLVWADFNDNGVVDAGEPGIPRVAVRLLAADAATVLATTVTDASGRYLFAGLAPGTYYVDAAIPRDTVSSHDIASSADPNNDRDNDDNGVVAGGGVMRSGAVTLGFGTEPVNDGDGNADTNLTVDFGFVPLTDGGFLADVCLQQAFPPTVIAGGQMTATYTAANRGPGPATNLVIDGMLPTGVSVVSMTPSSGGVCAVEQDMAVCRWPGLTPAGVSRSTSIVFRVDPSVPAGTPLALWFMSSADTVDAYPACNMVDAYIFVTDGGTSADLALSAAAVGGSPTPTGVAVAVNQSVTTQFTVTNTGRVPARGRYAVLLDDVGVVELTATSTSQGVMGIGTTTSGAWETDVIPPGGSATLSLRFVPRTGGAAQIQVIRTEGLPADPNALNDRAAIDIDAIGTGGGRFVAAGNVDGAAGAEIITAAGLGETPQVRVFAGGGAPRMAFYAFNRSFRGGVRVASCDVDADGVDELVTAMGPGGGRVRVLSLVSGAVNEYVAFDAFESTFTGGVNVACADLDNDGRAEVVVGPDGGRAPDVKIFSVGVLTAAVTAQFQAYESSFTGGVRVAARRHTGSAAIGAFNVMTVPGPGRPSDLRAWMAGAGAAAPIAAFRLTAGSTGTRIALGDANGDGGLDLVVTPDAGSPSLLQAYSLATGGIVLDVAPGAAGYASAIAATGVLAGGSGPELIVARGAGQVPVVSVIRVGAGGALAVRLTLVAAEIP